MHVRFGDILDNDWNVVVPSTNRFVVGRSQESTVLIDESDSVDSAKMLVVCLYNLSCTSIVLPVSGVKGQTYLDDLLICHTGQPDILLISIRVERDDIRSLPVRECLDTLSGFCVPHFDISVVGCRKEFIAFIVEGDIFDSLGVAHERP